MKYAKLPDESTDVASLDDPTSPHRDEGLSSALSTDSEDSEKDDSEVEREKRLKELQDQVSL